MAKVLVMYFSKHGSTKKYVEWIAAELNGDVCDIKNVKPNMPENYETIILGTALYAGKIEGINIIMNNYEKLKNKKIIIYTCGLFDYRKTENINTVKKTITNILPDEMAKNIKIYCLRGGIDYKKLNLMHRMMMWMMKTMLTKKEAEKRNEEDNVFLETYGKTVDFTDKNSITDIIEYYK